MTALRRLVVCVLLVVLASVAAAGDEAAIERASQYRQDYILDMESEGLSPYVYLGHVSSIQEQAKFSGVFPFVAFRAKQLVEGEDRVRFWHVNYVSINQMTNGAGAAYDELLIGDDRWFSHFAQPVRKYEEKDHGPFRYKVMCMDPRVAILCLTGGLELSFSLYPDKYMAVVNGEILSATQGLRELTAVVRAGIYDAHIVFDEAQGNRPTTIAICKKGEEMGEDFANATNIARARWRQNTNGIWMPEAGESRYYFRGTKSNHKFYKQINYKVHWGKESDLPEGTFSKESVYSSPGALLEKMADWVEKAEKVKDMGE